MDRLTELIQEILEWHEATFPDMTEEKQDKKRREELEEFDKARDNDDIMFEAADVFIATCGLARFNFYAYILFMGSLIRYLNDKQLVDLPYFVKRKLAINKAREFDENGQHKE